MSLPRIRTPRPNLRRVLDALKLEARNGNPDAKRRLAAYRSRAQGYHRRAAKPDERRRTWSKLEAIRRIGEVEP